MKLFHASPKSNLESIKKQGLIPKKIHRGEGFENTPPAIYTYSHIHDAEDGLMNWLMDLKEDEEEWMILSFDYDGLIEEDPELPGVGLIIYEAIPFSKITIEQID